MKLVYILAHELKAWPEDCEAIEQDRRGTCLFKVNGPAIATYVGSLADDADTAKVTRAQWQAAVDALKVESTPAWDGIRLPPVGTVCEYDARAFGEGDPLWVTVEVKYLSEWTIVFACIAVPEGTKQENIGVELSADVGVPTINRFRQILTPEQIAEEVRDREIADLYFTINWNEGRETWPMISIKRKADYAKAIDAGYRKFEITDDSE